MKLLPVFCFCVFLSAKASFADSVVLFVGDGMGVNHTRCAGKELFMDEMPVQTTFKTFSADNAVTDSAAAGTAFACGIKTKNKFVALTPDEKPCVTLTEQSLANGLTTGLYSTDKSTGTTPACFFAHTVRSDEKRILQALETAEKTTDIVLNLPDLKTNTRSFLQKAANTGKPFFLMIEQAHIDLESHRNNFDAAMAAVIDLDEAVRIAAGFTKERPDMTVVVVADHETGGLTDDCLYTTDKHTGADVRLTAAGKHAALFVDVKDNTDVHARIRAVLRMEPNGLSSKLTGFYRRMKAAFAD